MLDTKKVLCPINLLTGMECREKSAMLNIDYPAGSKHPGNLFYLRMYIKFIISVRIGVGGEVWGQNLRIPRVSN